MSKKLMNSRHARLSVLREIMKLDLEVLKHLKATSLNKAIKQIIFGAFNI